MSEPKTRPARDTGEAYERYLKGMDDSMRQKVALTAAHLPAAGRVADLGMGSGAGSHALAALYPALDVVGVDLDPKLVERARQVHRLPNLTFRVGDVCAPPFEPESLDGILDSSVLHHVTSFGDYQHGRVEHALAAQVRLLRPGGVLVLRDFLAPDAPDAPVLLDLPGDDGAGPGDPRTESSAELFRRFGREFRACSARPGFPYEELGPVSPPQASRTSPKASGEHARWRRFHVAHRHAVEFVLRKDYRTDWEDEVKEEYTFATQAQLEALFASLGLRVLASTPLRNPWILRERFQGRFALCGLDGRELESPATNYLIAGERVPPGEGVRFQDAGAVAPLHFLEPAQFRRRSTGQVLELVRRPNPTIDILPWFDQGGDLFVLARTSYPRPILGQLEAAPLDGARPIPYASEPLTLVQGDKPLGQTVEEALEVMAGIAPDHIRSFHEGSTYYPSPGGLQEEVRSVFVEIEPRFAEARQAGASGFSTSGRVRAIEARQLLRAAQVGGLPDARLELNVYDLLLRLGRDPGPWLGDVARPGDAPVERTSLADLLARPGRRAFERLLSPQPLEFLELACQRFEELDAGGEVLHQKTLELVRPRARSALTVATALLRAEAGEVFLGVADDDLPAAQCFRGNSELLVAPAWRLPAFVASRRAALAWIGERLRAEYGLEAEGTFELGGGYHPSAGLTPEVVYPIAFLARPDGLASRPLAWVRLRELCAQRDAIADGHLRIVALRAAHAAGLLDRR